MIKIGVSPTEVTAELFSFAEESCWDKAAKFKQQRTPVRFRMTSVGKTIGLKLDGEFISDYGLYYEPDDDYIIGTLTDHFPDVNWAKFNYWRKPDHTKIEILNPDNDRTVGKIVTMSYAGKPVSHLDVDQGHFGPNVVSFETLRLRRGVRLTLDRVKEAENDGQD